MKLSRRILWTIAILSYVGVAISYFYLPDQIPIHWNSNWEIDNWVDKNYIFLIGLLPVLILLLFKFLPQIDPKWYNYKKHTKPYNVLEITLVLFMIILDWITIFAALGLEITVLKRIMPIALGIMFIIMGNYLPKLKSNYFFGIKNPWTLSDDGIWRKTHKAGGYIFAITGVFMVIAAVIQKTSLNNIIFVILMIGIIGVNIYSYILFHKTKVD